MKKEKPFKLESELCAAFIAALPDSWTAYPETAGWDILLVRKADGVQIGIQAKLKLNGNVLTQCLEEYGSWGATRPGPDYRAVLVPPGEAGWETICTYIGVSVLSLTDSRWDSYGAADAKWRVTPRLPGSPHCREEHWHEWMPEKRHDVPAYVPDVAAGVAAPVQLTSWKIKAIKISVLLKRRGYVTRADFKSIGIDNRRWMPAAGHWLTIDKSVGGYRAGKNLPNFEAQHPKNWQEIDADYDQWAPKPAVLV